MRDNIISKQLEVACERMDHNDTGQTQSTYTILKPTNMAKTEEPPKISIEDFTSAKRRSDPLPRPDLNASNLFNHEVLNTRPKYEIFLGRLCFCYVITCWQVISVAIIFLQLILTLTSRLSSNRLWQGLHRRAVGALLHLLIIPAICTLYFWNSIEMRLVMANKSLRSLAFEPIVCLMVPNHSNDIDYLLCAILADQLKNIKSYKPLVKNELKYMPIFGWVLWLSDVPFVRREWSEDRLNLGNQLDRLLDFQQCVLCLFAEGTRWTQDKQRASEEYAAQKGFKPFKYHLYPRKRGFNFAVRHYLLRLRDDRAKGIEKREFRIFNLQLLSSKRLTLNDFLNGRDIKTEVYIEDVPISEDILKEVYESKTEEECVMLNQLVVAMYRRKDEIVEEYRNNGCQLPLTGERGLYPFEGHRRAPLFTLIFGLSLVNAFFLHLATTIGWSYCNGFLAVIAVSCYFFIRRWAKEGQSRQISSFPRSPPPTPVPEDPKFQASLWEQMDRETTSQ